MDQVRDHLKEYLDRSYRVLSGKQDKIDQNLYLLIIQCFEVCYYNVCPHKPNLCSYIYYIIM